MSGANEAALGYVRAVAEALADVLEERGLLVAGVHASPARVLDAAQVALLLGRDRQWVYDHASELGAFRYGDGPKARIGFDLAMVESWKRDRQVLKTTRRSPSTSHRSARRAGTASSLIPYEAHGPRP